MTLGDIKTRAAARLDVDQGTGAAFTPADIAAAANRGQRIFCALTLAVERQVPFPLSSGVCWFSPSAALPDWFLPLRVSCQVSTGTPSTALWGLPLWGSPLWNEPDSVTVTGSNRLRPATLGEMDALDPQWQMATAPAPLRYGTAGWSLAFIYPAPLADLSVDVTYAAMPRPLAADSDVPEIPEEYHCALVDWAVYELPALRLGGSYLQKALPVLGVYLEAAAKCAAYVRARSLSRRYDVAPFELTAQDRSRLIGKAARIREAKEVGAA